MTHIRLKYQNGQFIGFSAEGHAGYDNAEYDMVCTAISVLITTTINSLESVAGIKPIYNSIDEENGIISIDLPNGIDKAKMHDSQIILKTMLQGLKDIKQEFPEYISLEA